MKKEQQFKMWMEDNRDFQQNTISSRIGNIHTVESVYGEIDDLYAEDKCEGLIDLLSYSLTDFKNDIPPRHQIEIDGNAYTGTASLLQAVRRYVEFLKWEAAGGMPVMVKIGGEFYKVATCVLNSLREKYGDDKAGLKAEIMAVGVKVEEL